MEGGAFVNGLLLQTKGKSSRSSMGSSQARPLSLTVPPAKLFFVPLCAFAGLLLSLTRKSHPVSGRRVNHEGSRKETVSGAGDWREFLCFLLLW